MSRKSKARPAAQSGGSQPGPPPGTGNPLSARLRDAVVRWTRLTARNPVQTLLVIAAITTLSAVFAYRLVTNVRTDFASLLPETDRSVQNLKKLGERYGSERGLLVVIYCETKKDPGCFEDSKRLAGDIAGKLKPLEGTLIRQVVYQNTEDHEFYRKYKYLFMDTEDLAEIQDRLDIKLRFERVKNSPVAVKDLLEDPGFDLADIEEKYGDREKKQSMYTDGYFTNGNGAVLPDGRELGPNSVVALQVTALGSGLDFGGSGRLLKTIQGIIDGLAPAKNYNPLMEVGLTGSIARSNYEVTAVVTDTVRTAALTILLCFALILLYYRRFRPVVFMTVAVLAAICWTFAVSWFQIGYLNQQTAFLASIIIGNGINFSLILMARYFEERERGLVPEDAIVSAAENTFEATQAAAAATAAAYGVLIFTSFKGFSQFGFMGGLGMVFCWLASYTIIPALITLTERWRPMVAPGRRQTDHEGRLGSAWIAQAVVKAPRAIIAACGALTVISMFFVWIFLKDPFEYNFSKLRSRDDPNATYVHFRRLTWDMKLEGGGGGSVFLVDSAEEAAMLVEAANARRDELEAAGPPGSTITGAHSIFTQLPENQEEKIRIISDIREMVERQPMGWLSEKHRKRLDEFREAFDIRPVTIADLPENIRKRFTERDGTFDKVVLIQPKPDVSLSNGRNLLRFASEIESYTLENGKTVHTSGDAMLFADMLAAISRDGPVATAMCLMGVFGIIFVSFGGLKKTVFILFFLLYGILLLVGCMGIWDLKINFFNFVVIPITIGIGVDYHINVFKRYALEGPGSIEKTLRSTGGAVLLCAGTTIIGYAMMTLSLNQAMQNFGWIAIIGEITCVTSALLFKPAVILLEEERARRTGGAMLVE